MPILFPELKLTSSRDTGIGHTGDRGSAPPATEAHGVVLPWDGYLACSSMSPRISATFRPGSSASLTGTPEATGGPGNETDNGTDTMNSADIVRCATKVKDTGTIAEDVTTGTKDTGDVSVWLPAVL